MARAVSRRPLTQKARFQVHFVPGFMVDKKEVEIISP